MGARAVFVARPILWGLAYDGENGVKGVLELFRSEFKMALALSGLSDLDGLLGEGRIFNCDTVAHVYAFTCRLCEGL
jgi:isopentenyl diphosphate isomerase/L-lactate dehydrogenase-like FMN-dependent dehydrogenase